MNTSHAFLPELKAAVALVIPYVLHKINKNNFHC